MVAQNSYQNQGFQGNNQFNQFPMMQGMGMSPNNYQAQGFGRNDQFSQNPMMQGNLSYGNPQFQQYQNYEAQGLQGYNQSAMILNQQIGPAIPIQVQPSYAINQSIDVNYPSEDNHEIPFENINIPQSNFQKNQMAKNINY